MKKQSLKTHIYTCRAVTQKFHNEHQAIGAIFKNFREEIEREIESKNQPDCSPSWNYLHRGATDAVSLITRLIKVKVKHF